MKASLALLELVIGILIAAGVLVTFASMSAISEPIWGTKFCLYWGSLLAGPFGLIAGAVLTLFRKWGKSGPLLSLASSAILTCWAMATLMGLPSELARLGSNSSLELKAAVIVLMIVGSDLAAYKIYRIMRTEERRI